MWCRVIVTCVVLLGGRIASTTTDIPPICNGYNYVLPDHQTPVMLTTDQLHSVPIIHHPHCTTSLDHACQSYQHSQYILCLSNTTCNIPQCYVCCPTRQFRDNVENVKNSLDRVYKGLHALTNTILIYDKFVQRLQHEAMSVTLGLKIKHELYYVLRNIYELQNMASRGESINISNKKAVKRWLVMAKSALTVAEIKLKWLHFQDVVFDMIVEKLHKAIRIMLIPIRGWLCGIKTVQLISESTTRKGVDVLDVYVVATSCLRTAVAWYDFVNDIRYMGNDQQTIIGLHPNMGWRPFKPKTLGDTEHEGFKRQDTPDLRPRHTRDMSRHQGWNNTYTY